ncbi:uncharacterized protein LOC124203304 isoform X2 [Daphnia pulex]|uniref:uncharacterized protein LOC124203304 isoform X2 n=1 Tax=Daphnia pulex TaxID=6669 RepID=UPI001EDF93BE|nr:uncharacterized protein LOC124203304 isoform X2 [Daphnia pulex]
MAPPHHMERRCTRSHPSSTRSSHRRSMSFLPLCYLIAAVSCCWTTPVGAGWQDDIQPRRSITLDLRPERAEPVIITTRSTPVWLWLVLTCHHQQSQHHHLGHYMYA